MKQVLFIGGDADGIRRMVHDSTNSIESNEGRYFIHEYLTDSESLYFATQSEEDDTCEIMQALFNGYQQPIESDGAVSLAELVPNPSDNKYWGNDGNGTRFKVQTYHGDVLAILRNIEEQGKC